MSLSTQQHAIVPEDNYRFERAMEAILAGTTAGTERAYKQRIRSFLEWRIQQPPGDHMIIHLRNYITYLQVDRELSASTIKSHISTVKQLIIMSGALYPEFAVYIPMLKMVKTPPVRGQVHGTRLTPRQAQRLINTPGTYSRAGLRDTTALALMAVCGMRCTEVATMKWGDMEAFGNHRLLHIRSSKGRDRTIKLPRWLWRVALHWFRRSFPGNPTLPSKAHEYVFIRLTPRQKWRRKYDEEGNPQPLAASSIYRIVERHCKDAGLPHVSPHDLRRTAASLSRDGDASIEQVQMMLGHASPQTTSQYIGDNLDWEDNAVDHNPLVVSDIWVADSRYRWEG